MGDEIPAGSWRRNARMAAIPLAAMGRATWGLGKRLGGQSAELVAAEMQARGAEQVFRVLGELKGGAMKFGQVMSVLEAALPADLAEPYRETLVKLQEAAPAMPAETVHGVLAGSLGEEWRDHFQAFEDDPAAAASIGQVHRATWHDGRDVAVKVQYPGAGDALMADLAAISRLGRTVGSFLPGVDIGPILAELQDRVVEELDYRLEAEAQQTFSDAYADDPHVVVPGVVHAGEHVIVSEWLDGRPLSDVISSGTKEQRDEAGWLFTRFLFSGPSRAGMLHADPHPGNFRITREGRIGVMDYGAAARLPDGFPPEIGLAMSAASAGDSESMVETLREAGFVRPNVSIKAAELLDYLAPFVEPASTETFHFTRSWMQQQFRRVNDPREPGYSLGLKLNLPPGYLLIHRVWLAGVGVLCQLGAEVPVRGELLQWIPGLELPEIPSGVVEGDQGRDASAEPGSDVPADRGPSPEADPPAGSGASSGTGPSVAS
jgi:predicted unusual protein kinase regulating ubiquinone biosynthesis (AarF/ABC1/UbiB family)